MANPELGTSVPMKSPYSTVFSRVARTTGTSIILKLFSISLPLLQRSSFNLSQPTRSTKSAAFFLRLSIVVEVGKNSSSQEKNSRANSTLREKKGRPRRGFPGGFLLRILLGFDCFRDSLFDIVQFIGERLLFFFGHAVAGRYVLNDLQRSANAREIAHCSVFGFGHRLTNLGRFFPTARSTADRAAWNRRGVEVVDQWSVDFAHESLVCQGYDWRR